MQNEITNQNLSLSVIILTLNEEKHLKRCISSFKEISDDLIIIDSYSTDQTREISNQFGARFYQRKFISHSDQINWAINNLSFKNKWILRIDADEYLSPKLLREIKITLKNLPNDINGLYLNRYIKFQGQLIRYGGIFPFKCLRIFKKGYGFCENRLMDEHLIVRGKKINLKNPLIDENLNSLSWWIEKHNLYSSREAIELLKLKHKLKPSIKANRNIRTSQSNSAAKIKRSFYLRMPVITRSLIYFIYRYIIRLGFLDGYRGLTFHFLQAFWYRYLIDAKIHEFEIQVKVNKLSKNEALYKLFNYEIN